MKSKKVINEEITEKDQCNCKNNNNTPIDVKCEESDMYKFIASTTINQGKVYPGLANANFKIAIP